MTFERATSMFRISEEINAIAEIASEFAIAQFGPEADDEHVAKSAETQTIIDIYSGGGTEIATLLAEIHSETLRRIRFKLATGGTPN